MKKEDCYSQQETLVELSKRSMKFVQEMDNPALKKDAAWRLTTLFLNEATKKVALAVCQNDPIRYVLLMLFMESDKQWKYCIEKGYPEGPQEHGVGKIEYLYSNPPKGALQKVFEHGKPMFFPDACHKLDTAYMSDWAKKKKINSIIVIPVALGTDFSYLVVIDAMGEKKGFSPHEVSFITSAQMVLDNACREGHKAWMKAKKKREQAEKVTFPVEKKMNELEQQLAHVSRNSGTAAGLLRVLEKRAGSKLDYNELNILRQVKEQMCLFEDSVLLFNSACQGAWDRKTLDDLWPAVFSDELRNNAFKVVADPFAARCLFSQGVTQTILSIIKKQISQKETSLVFSLVARVNEDGSVLQIIVHSLELSSSIRNHLNEITDLLTNLGSLCGGVTLSVEESRCVISVPLAIESGISSYPGNGDTKATGALDSRMLH